MKAAWRMVLITDLRDNKDEGREPLRALTAFVGSVMPLVNSAWRASKVASSAARFSLRFHALVQLIDVIIGLGAVIGELLNEGGEVS